VEEGIGSDGDVVRDSDVEERLLDGDGADLRGVVGGEGFGGGGRAFSCSRANFKADSFAR
jgi:hypothetical protein